MVQIVERAAFTELIRDALAHLYDPPHLRGHPLTELLSTRDVALDSSNLRRALLDAIEQIRPPEEAPAHSASRRRYRYLYLRYVEGVSHEDIARDLLISIRQAHRDHHEGLDAVSSLLWVRYGDRRKVEDPDSRGQTVAVQVGDQAEGSDLALGSELRRGGFTPGDGPVDLREVIDGVIEIVRTLAARRGTKIEAALPPTLPLVAGDRTIIRQVLLSLLSYVIEIEPRAQLVVDTLASHGSTIVQVWSRQGNQGDASSTGADRPSEVAELLVAAQQLAKLHGLVVRVSADAATTGRKKPIGEVTIPVAHPLTVLVVDDNPDVAQLFERYLPGQSYRILPAKTWQQALKLAETVHPDIISLDVMMPSQDGWDIHQRLKARPDLASIPVVMCSVLPERSLALAMGASAFLPKPITRQNLLDALRNCRTLRR